MESIALPMAVAVSNFSLRYGDDVEDLIGAADRRRRVPQYAYLKRKKQKRSRHPAHGSEEGYGKRHEGRY
jgi:hypothetical protein